MEYSTFIIENSSLCCPNKMRDNLLILLFYNHKYPKIILNNTLQYKYMKLQIQMYRN